MIPEVIPGDRVAQRAKALHFEHRNSIAVRTDRLFAGLLVFEWLVAILIALTTSPVTWSGETSSTHPHLLAAIFLGATMIALPIFLALKEPGKTLTRHIIAIVQMLMSSLLIDVTGGRIETHFHIFGSLAFLAFYRDWRVLITASVVTTLDHILRGIYTPQAVYGEWAGTEWRWVEHAGWVFFEDIFLIWSCLRSGVEMRAISERRAELEDANAQLALTADELRVSAAALAQSRDLLEQRVQERTRELEVSRGDLRRVIERAHCLLWVGHVREESLDTDLPDPIENVTVMNEAEVLKWLPIGQGDGEPFVSAWLNSRHPDDIGPGNERNRNALLSGAERYTRTYRSIVADGNVRWLQEDVRVELREPTTTGRTWRLTGIVTDVTERKRAEEKVRQAHDELEFRVAERTRDLRTATEQAEAARQEADRANRAKSEFLSRMSHELRTPLNAILGFGQILDKNDLSELQRESVRYILHGGRHLLDLVNEVLDIARVEAGHDNPHLEPVCLAELISETIALMRPLAYQRGISLDDKTDGASARTAIADRQRLKQVLLNLLSNGIKYNRSGGAVSLLCEDRAENEIRLSVCDTGFGIPPEDLSKLFTPFERLGASASTIEGTGLGLALSERLVTAMGGRLTVESEVGKGSIFHIALARSAEPLAAVSSAANVPNTDEAKGLLLIIAANPPALCLHDVRILSADRGQEGLDFARNHDPDLILLGSDLPDATPAEMILRLRRSALTRDIPVLRIDPELTAIEEKIDALLTERVTPC